MTDPEWEALWMIASSLWPGDPASSSKRVHKAWQRPLGGWSLEELGGALERLAQREPRFPALATVVEACREIRGHEEREGLVLLPAPRRRQWELQEFDVAAEQRREEYREELWRYAQNYQPWVAQGISEAQWRVSAQAWVATVGPCEQRARERVTSGLTVELELELPTQEQLEGLA